MFSPALADLVDVVKGSNARQLRLLKEAAEDLRLDARQRSHRLKFTKIYVLIRHACAGERLASKAPVLPSAVLTWLAGSGEALTSETDAARFQTLNGGVKPSDAPRSIAQPKRERGAFSPLAFSRSTINR